MYPIVVGDWYSKISQALYLARQSILNFPILFLLMVLLSFSLLLYLVSVTVEKYVYDVE